MADTASCKACVSCYKTKSIDSFNGKRKQTISVCLECREKATWHSNREDVRAKKRICYLTSIRDKIQSYKRGAEARGIPWHLDDMMMDQIILSPCYYCNTPPVARINGIDRMDSCAGYVLNNVVPCCNVCNRMKSTLDSKTFVARVVKIGRHCEGVVQRQFEYQASNMASMTMNVSYAFRVYQKHQPGKAFELSFDNFAALVSNACFYCGQHYQRMGVDRYDSDNGYTVDNCVPCCTTCNLVKGALHGDVFIAHCVQLAKIQTETPSVFPDLQPLTTCLQKRPTSFTIELPYVFDWRDYKPAPTEDDRNLILEGIKTTVNEQVIVVPYTPKVNGRYLDYVDELVDELQAFRRTKDDYTPTLFDASHHSRLSGLNWDMDGVPRIHLQQSVMDVFPSLAEHGYNTGQRIYLSEFVWLILEGRSIPAGHTVCPLNGYHEDVRMENLMVVRDFQRRQPDTIIPSEGMVLPGKDRYLPRGLRVCGREVLFIPNVMSSIYGVSPEAVSHLPTKSAGKSAADNARRGYDAIIAVTGKDVFDAINQRYQRLTYEYRRYALEEDDPKPFNGERQTLSDNAPSSSSLLGHKPKVQKYSADGQTLIKTYVSISDTVRQENREISESGLVDAIRKNTLYSRHRWVFLDRTLPDCTVQHIGDPGEMQARTVERGAMVAMLDLKREKVLHVFADKKAAAEHLSLSPAFVTKAIQGGKECLRKCYLCLWRDCGESLCATFEGVLPEKRVHARSKVVYQLDPKTHAVVRTFQSVALAKDHLGVGKSTLLDALDHNKELKGSLWATATSHPP